MPCVAPTVGLVVACSELAAHAPASCFQAAGGGGGPVLHCPEVLLAGTAASCAECWCWLGPVSWAGLTPVSTPEAPALSAEAAAAGALPEEGAGCAVAGCVC